MLQPEKVACVTGGSGMVGAKIVDALLRLGYRVRVLSRQHPNVDMQAEPHVEVIEGDLRDESTLIQFFSGAELVFHCAAELLDLSLMWDINVEGTKTVLNICRTKKIKYFCYLSSAGVVGKTNESLVSESSVCCPQNMYERSKWAAEQLVNEGIEGASVVVLRPTNVIDDEHPGAILLGKRPGLKNRLKLLFKGGESAHLVHAEDVARAATYFIDSSFKQPECFFVSCDHEPYNTFAGVAGVYQSCISNKQEASVSEPFYLPLFIPYLIRRLARGGGNIGNVKYSSKKLMDSGFSFKHGLKKMVDGVVLNDEK